MTSEQREALVEYLHAVLAAVSRHASTADQARLLESWQELYRALIGEDR